MEAVITNAIESGYRHIDTAFNYNNEEAIGNSLKKWFAKGGKREDIFITTKVQIHLVAFTLFLTRLKLIFQTFFSVKVLKNYLIKWVIFWYFPKFLSTYTKATTKILKL